LSSDNVPVNLDAGRNGSPMLKVTDRWIRTRRGALQKVPSLLVDESLVAPASFSVRVRIHFSKNACGRRNRWNKC
jgi:hypothetical protein